MDTKRFNNPHYKSQVRAQRAYKRTVPKQTPGTVHRFRWIALAGVIAAGLVYLAYFATFLRITNVQVSGADAGVTAQVQGALNSYLTQHPYGLPQRNVIFFMPGKFASFLAAGNQQISQVVSVKRKWWHTVEVSVVQRVPLYTLQVGSTYHVVYSDGTIGEQLAGPQNFAIVDASTADAAVQGSALFTQQQLTFVKYISGNLPKSLQVSLAQFELNSRTDTTLTVVTQSGTRFLFDDTADPQLSVSRLQVLWGQLTPAQQAKLAYFDLRFDPKAYGCYRGDPCAATGI